MHQKMPMAAVLTARYVNKFFACHNHFFGQVLAKVSFPPLALGGNIFCLLH